LKVGRDTGQGKIYYFVRVLSGGREQAEIGRFASPGPSRKAQ
jgi:hypothetical protein